jgi:hypothetical protein
VSVLSEFFGQLIRVESGVSDGPVEMG